MTARPLTYDFPLMSPMSSTAPHAIPIDEQLLELEIEEDYRARAYPGQVKRGTMSEEEAVRHMAIWKQIRLDVAPPPADLPPKAIERYWNEWVDRRAASPIRWADKVREIRRELAMRRNFYPKQIQRGGDSAELAQRMERLEAVHFAYWIELQYFDAIAEPKAAGYARLGRANAMRDRWLVDAYEAAEPAIVGYRYAADLNRYFHSVACALTLLRFPPAAALATAA